MSPRGSLLLLKKNSAFRGPVKPTPPKNSPLLGPTKSTPNEKFLPFPFPSPTEPVPDAPIDYTELWKAVSMAKGSDTAKSNTSKDTQAYDITLQRLGIDITPNSRGEPKDVINLGDFQLPQTVEYPNLSTDEQLQALAKRYEETSATKMNEATLAARIMQAFFIFQGLPKPTSFVRSNVPCQILEFRTAFTSYYRFNKDLYTFVRGLKKERASPPQESDLRSRSDLTFMAHANAIGMHVRNECENFPGVHSEYGAIAPFLSIEFKASNESAKAEE